MDILIEVKTPPGNAKKIEKRLKPFLLGTLLNKKVNHKVSINKDDSMIVWSVEAPYKKIMKINRNVTAYDMIVKKVLSDKRLISLLDKPEDKEALKEMLTDQTKIRIVKRGEQEENKSFWSRIFDKGN